LWKAPIADQGTRLEWFSGMLCISSLLAAMSGLSWLVDARAAWLVGPSGVEVYRGGTLRRTIRWEEFNSLRVKLIAAHATLKKRPYVEHLYWLARTDSTWLEEFAREHLAQVASADPGSAPDRGNGD
jgi:hypothetical protein